MTVQYNAGASVQVSLRLPAELVQAIDATAQETCRTRSSQIEFFLRTSIEPPSRPVAPQASGSA